MTIERDAKSAVVAWVILVAAIIAAFSLCPGCAITSEEWGSMTRGERLKETIADAKHTAAAIRWIAPIADIVVAGSCPECVAGYRAASAAYQGLSILVDAAAYQVECKPEDPGAQARLIELTHQAKEAWSNLDAAYKGDPEPMIAAAEEVG